MLKAFGMGAMLCNFIKNCKAKRFLPDNFRIGCMYIVNANEHSRYIVNANEHSR
ncbi:MAG: hypothetical protein JXR70_10795 [Spirochaetales bacterium]|nr:hypothetical protein [Spirochaetales bacterium]